MTQLQELPTRPDLSAGPGRNTTGDWRTRISCVLSAILLGVFLLAARSAKSDTVIFNDLTDRVTVSTTGTRVVVPSSPLFTCGTDPECIIVDILAPLGATGFTTTLQPIIGIGEPAAVVTKVSDAIEFSAPSFAAPFSEFVFTSDPSALLNVTGCINLIFGCPLTEDGSVQTATTITWSFPDGSTVVDTVQFQSDVSKGSEVPEPSSILLSLIGFAGLGFTKLRGKVAKRS